MSGLFVKHLISTKTLDFGMYPVCRHNDSNNNSIDAVEETAVALLVASNVLPLFHQQHHF
jgi:hypothetical protein